MNTLDNYITEYLEYCEYRKRLDSFITSLHKQYKPKTVKRKIASLKAFFHYLEYKDLLAENPFDKLDVHFREAKLLPKTIPFHSIQKFLSVLYEQKSHARKTVCWEEGLSFFPVLFAN